MISEVVCDCGAIFDDESGVKWHRTTEGHLWFKLKMETDNHYVHIRNSAKMKIPENVRCDICGEPAHLKRLRVKGKRVPDWFVVANKEKPTIRCKKCKRDRLNLIKVKFAKLLRQRAVVK